MIPLGVFGNDPHTDPAQNYPFLKDPVKALKKPKEKGRHKKLRLGKASFKHRDQPGRSSNDGSTGSGSLNTRDSSLSGGQVDGNSFEHASQSSSKQKSKSEPKLSALQLQSQSSLPQRIDSLDTPSSWEPSSASSDQSSRVRSRHVEIVIPEWASNSNNPLTPPYTPDSKTGPYRLFPPFPKLPTLESQGINSRTLHTKEGTLFTPSLEAATSSDPSSPVEKGVLRYPAQESQSSHGQHEPRNKPSGGTRVSSICHSLSESSLPTFIGEWNSSHGRYEVSIKSIRDDPTSSHPDSPIEQNAVHLPVQDLVNLCKKYEHSTEPSRVARAPPVSNPRTEWETFPHPVEAPEPLRIKGKHPANFIPHTPTTTGPSSPIQQDTTFSSAEEPKASNRREKRHFKFRQESPITSGFGSSVDHDAVPLSIQESSFSDRKGKRPIKFNRETAVFLGKNSPIEWDTPPSSLLEPMITMDGQSPAKNGVSSREQESFGGNLDGAAPVATTSAQLPPETNNAAQANNLTSLVCNVLRTTGDKPSALVGASTTILDDRLFVFGGRKLSQRKPQLTQDLYQLDLATRNWSKEKTQGQIPAPRYFHSLCALGNTKLVCYGGMAPATQLRDYQPEINRNDKSQQEPGIIVMSDVHIYDIVSKTWTAIAAPNAPPGRYAHCATILPSSGIFTSDSAPLSAIRHNPASPNPNQGSLGVTIDGRGGAEMIIVGGQDGTSHYIEQISVFNLRSLKWTSNTNMGRSCGAYRSVVTPVPGPLATQIGTSSLDRSDPEQSDEDEESSSSSDHATLIYSNYNFLDVKLELQIRQSDGKLVEKQMKGGYSPPGLRFPNGDIIGNHFIVSGTFLTSTRQEYALWALDLRTLSWSRIDTGPGILASGSWNRGVLWKRRNSYVILGDRRRNLHEDYNHRQLNFANMCLIELEAFGLYENPVSTTPWSSVSMSSPNPHTDDPLIGDVAASDEAAQHLGSSTALRKEICDMDFLAIGGERLPVNSHIIARRWGPYFTNLLEKNLMQQDTSISEASTLRDAPSRNSSVTITPGSVNSFSHSMTDALNSIESKKARALAAGSVISDSSSIEKATSTTIKSRLLYLPHTFFTLRALVHFLYTWSLPAAGTPLCTPQILCSLLQVARPYRINGLLEATLGRLHELLDGRNTAAIFNAAAMAAGGGDDIAFQGYPIRERRRTARHAPLDPRSRSRLGLSRPSTAEESASEEESGVDSSAAESSEAESGTEGRAGGRKVWDGELSSVIGLQKRGLRGLMEGRKLRERGNADEPTNQGQDNA